MVKLGVSVKITGPDIRAALMQDYQRRYKRVNDAVQGAGIRCQALAKQKAPVGTPESTGIPGYKGGRLRASILYQPADLRVVVSTNVNYSKFVEFGTVKMAARPFFWPSYSQARQEMLSELSSIK